MEDYTKKTKLLIASDSTLPRLDGVSIFLMNLVPKLTKFFDITIIAPRFKENIVGLEVVEKYFGDVRNVYTIATPFMAGDFFIPLPSFKIKKEVEQADVVFVHSIGPVGLTTLYYAKLLGKKVVTYIHSIEIELWMKSIKSTFWRRLIRRAAKNLMKFAYKRSDQLLVPSEELFEVLVAQKIKTPMTIVSGGVDTRRFIPPEDKDDAKARIHLYDKFVIGYVGRIGREKDLETLVAAFEHLEKTNHNIVLLIVGAGLDKKLKQEITSKNIILTGLKEDTLPYFQAMDVFVLPSLTETSSLATLEAMSCGLPVVVTPVGVLKEIIDKGENGYLFPKGSVDVLITHLEKIMKSEPLRKKLGKNARTTIREHFSWDLTAQKILDVLRKV